MPFVKIVQKGWETFNGILPGVGIQFENAVSKEPISLAEAERIGAFMRIVDAETNEPISIGERMVRNRRKNHEDLGLIHSQTTRLKRTPTGKPQKPVEKAPAAQYDFTRESLEALADKGGIRKLREFSKKYNVNGKAIKDIIDTLMVRKDEAEKAKAKEQVAAQPAATPAPAKPESQLSDDDVTDVLDDDELDRLAQEDVVMEGEDS